jgi:hypothetical protein
MESNRGTKRREPDSINDGTNPCEEIPSKRRRNYKPPERARRLGGLFHRDQLESSWTPQLSDITVPRNEYQYSPINANSIRLLYI